ncbi:oxidoreductase [Actinoplanes sp. NPDC051851]|uniref:WD40/YVTN/BNR-like repeat-containing protein n=1 Tax=Actinoplanes sp. NPDC051851 TaxID=3154753 RepID=UPI0034323A78
MIGTGLTGPAHSPTWHLSDTGSTARFRGLAPVSSRVAWAAGSAGTVLRTVDGGRTWSSVGPAAAADLQFRDIEAFDADHAVALTIGSGTDSRVYTTADGGTTWLESFRNPDPAAFYDCLTFLDPRHGLALSDPVDGRFRILATTDGGRSWSVRPTTGMPEALPGEFAFAASGTCLVSAPAHDARSATSRDSAPAPAPGHDATSPVSAPAPGHDAWFATGGGATARVFATHDGGRTWSVSVTPIPSGPSAGVYGLAFRDARHGLAVGGDYATPTSAPSAAASTTDGARSWTVSRTPPGEYRSGVAWTSAPDTALAVGPTGSDITHDAGRTWHRFDTGTFDAVACTPDGSCWSSGAEGRVATLTS